MYRHGAAPQGEPEFQDLARSELELWLGYDLDGFGSVGYLRLRLVAVYPDAARAYHAGPR